MRPYEIQDEHSDNEQERVHARSASTDVTAKPVSARAAKRVKCAKVENVHDLGLGKANLVKLNGTIKKICDECRRMEELLIHAARHSTTISPKLVTQLASVKSGLEAELAAIPSSSEGVLTEHLPNSSLVSGQRRSTPPVLSRSLPRPRKGA